MADGARHHRVAAPARSRRSGQMRLRALPPRDDERVRRSAAHRRTAQCPLRGLCRPRARRPAAVSATIRSTVNRSLHARQSGLAHPTPQRRRPSACDDRRRHRGVIARRHEQRRRRRPRRSRDAARARSRRSAREHAIASSSDVPSPSVTEAHREQIEALDAAEHIGAEPGSSTCFSRWCSRDLSLERARAARPRRG